MNKNGWHCFLELCLASKEEKDLGALFDLFLTAEERESIATRCLLISELLAEEKPQRQISQELGISIAKITRGSNELKRISQKYKEYLRDMLVK